MSHKMILTISNDHFNWLELLQKERGLDNIQEAVRSVLEDSYTSDKKSRDTLGNVKKRRGRPREVVAV